MANRAIKRCEMWVESLVLTGRDPLIPASVNISSKKLLHSFVRPEMHCVGRTRTHDHRRHSPPQRTCTLRRRYPCECIADSCIHRCRRRREDLHSRLVRGSHVFRMVDSILSEVVTHFNAVNWEHDGMFCYSSLKKSQLALSIPVYSVISHPQPPQLFLLSIKIELTHQCACHHTNLG